MVNKKIIVPILVSYMALISCSRNGPSIPPPILSSSKNISSFVFKKDDNSFLTQDINGVITNDTIKVVLPFGSALTNLIPTITHSGKSLSPLDRTPQNFSGIITYTVTAENGSTQQYRVAVTNEPNSFSLYLPSAHANTGNSYIYVLDAKTGTLNWKYPTTSAILSSIEFSNNVIYTGIGKNITAIDVNTKAIRWQYLTGGTIYSTPMLVNGIVYINSDDQYLYAVDAATGALKWRFAQQLVNVGGNYSSPTVVNGVVYFGSMDGYIYAVDASTGALKWKTYNTYNAGGSFQSSPAVVNGVLYIGDTWHTLLALNISDGTFKWAYQLLGGGLMISSPTVENGIVYIGSSDNRLYAVDANTGTLKWQFGTGGMVDASPIINNGTVYIGSTGRLFAIDTLTGVSKWTFTYTNHFRSSPVIVDGVIYIGSYASILAVDASNGTLKWNYATTNGLEDVRASPCIVDKLGNVYVSSVSGSHN
jgi:outer membrane protein assembly factor BamB